MHHALAHRGSGSFGTYLDTHVGLSHARLSIRDIAGGSQPIIRQDGERTCAIVYNGEIYNTDELLPPLLAAGYTFSTTSDTEVILCAYLHYGRDFVSRLNGILPLRSGTAEPVNCFCTVTVPVPNRSSTAPRAAHWSLAPSQSALLPPGYHAHHR